VIRLLLHMHLHSIESMFAVCSSQSSKHFKKQRKRNSLNSMMSSREQTSETLLNHICVMLKQKRGIYGFLVVCDTTNNTPDVIDNNEFRADIFLKPAKSINYVTLTFVATRTGVSFEEVAGTV